MKVYKSTRLTARYVTAVCIGQWRWIFVKARHGGRPGPWGISPPWFRSGDTFLTFHFFTQKQIVIIINTQKLKYLKIKFGFFKTISI